MSVQINEERTIILLSNVNTVINGANSVESHDHIFPVKNISRLSKLNQQTFVIYFYDNTFIMIQCAEEIYENITRLWTKHLSPLDIKYQ